MKNTIKVRKNSSAAPSARQVKPSLGKTVVVIFYSPDDDRELFRVDFSERVFDAIRRGAKTLGVGLDKFFELAVLHNLRKAGIGPSNFGRPIVARGGAQ